ncbi:MAG: hypothetical protein H7067_07730 [Burkholderiales bacterium]|nr:hypothetical protein [Opitutaceae bacterium]
MALDRQFQIRETVVGREAHFLKQHGGVDRAVALRNWRRDAANLLQATLSWPTDASRRTRLIGQCIGELEGMSRQLYDRGWLLQQDRLLEVARTCLAPIAAAQAAGKIDDFWPYFRASVRRFVPLHAEELQRLARQTGGVVGAADVFAALSGVITERAAVTPVEAIGARHAERVQDACKPPTRRGRPPKFRAAAEATGDLFGV